MKKNREIRKLKTKLKTARFDALRDLFNLMPVDSAEFQYKESSDTGWINFTFYTGVGDPVKYQGVEQIRQFFDKKTKQVVDRKSGQYYPNDDFINLVIKRINLKNTKSA